MDRSRNVSLLREWWNEPSDYRWLIEFFRLRGFLTVMRLITGVQGLGVASTAGWVLNQRLAQPYALSLGLVIAAVALSLAWVACWWFLPWPTARQSAARVAGADIIITIVTIVQANPLAALTTTPLFAVVSIYLVFWHGPRASAAHTILAVAVIVATAVRVSGSGLPDAVPLAVSKGVLALTVTVGVLPFVQFGVWLMRSSSLESLADPLTSLANRRGLDNYLASNLGVLVLSPEPLCAFVIDLDAFKSVNDRYGHSVGDTVIARTAEQIRLTVRPSAFVARTGGEEFVVVDLLPPPAASAMAERVRAAIEAMEAPRCTASIGVSAGAIADVVDVAAICAAADQAMYAGKREGGNRVRVVGAEIMHRGAAEPPELSDGC